MRPDLVVEARAFVRGAFQDVEIGVDLREGRILAVRRTLTGDERLRLPGRLVVPSAVDVHVHFRDPGHPHKEDFATGTKSAALGGVGTVLDMPNTDPPVDRPGRLRDKLDQVAPKASVDWGLWCTLTEATRDPIELLRESVGAKLYLAPTTGMPAPEAPTALRDHLAMAAHVGRLVAVHAERLSGNPGSDLAGHDRARTPEGEVESIAAAARAAPAGARVHVAHATTADALAAARAAGWTAGVTPHHLLLDLARPGLTAFGKVNPPLRAPARRDGLWNAFARGEATVVESDHAPHTVAEKSAAFAEAPAGVPGVQTLLPLLLRQAELRGVDVARVIRAACEAPADLFGLSKGRIEPGFDADLVVFDPRHPVRLRGDRLASRCGWTPFEGWESYAVESHRIRGEPVVEDGAFVGRAGHGRRVRPGAPRPAALPAAEGGA